jgi:purine-binding chemotaxis protein CheW
MNSDYSGKIESYLTFKLDDELYAANVNNVISIIELTKITKVPRTPDFIKGVINLRGTVLPIIDMKIKFGLPPTEFTSNTSILVLDIQIDNELVKLGAIVDSVQEVLEISQNDILPAPSFGSNYQSEFVEGMYKNDDAFILILNIGRIFTEDELTTISSDLLFHEVNPTPANK